MAHTSMNLTINECENNKALITALLLNTGRKGMGNEFVISMRVASLLYLLLSIAITAGEEVWHSIVLVYIIQLKNKVKVCQKTALSSQDYYTIFIEIVAGDTLCRSLGCSW